MESISPMLPEDISDPEEWRIRAAKARAMAERSTEPVAKATMLDVAKAYENLARSAEFLQSNLD